MAIHLTATGRITIDGSPVRLGFNDVDHGGVDHVATFPVDPGAHAFSRDGPVNQHDPPVVPGKHRPAGDRAFDTQVENRFRHRHSLKDDPGKLEVVVEQAVSARAFRPGQGLGRHTVLERLELARRLGA